MKISVAFFLALLAPGLSHADELPSLDEKQWLGVYAGFQGRGFDYAVGMDGRSEIFFKEGRNRIAGVHDFLRVSYVLLENTGKKWTRRQMTEDGFTARHEASNEVEESSFVATFTGDTKVEIFHEFDKSEVVIRAKILEKTTKNPLRFGVVLSVPYVYKNRDGKEYSERELEDKVKGAELRGVRVSDGKRKKVGLWEEVKLADEELFAEGVTELLIDVPRYAGKRVTLSSGDPERAVIMLNNRGKLYSGFTAEWAIEEEHLANEESFLQIEVK